MGCLLSNVIKKVLGGRMDPNIYSGIVENDHCFFIFSIAATFLLIRLLNWIGKKLPFVIRKSKQLYCDMLKQTNPNFIKNSTGSDEEYIYAKVQIEIKIKR
jgi:hypothetical protein